MPIFFEWLTRTDIVDLPLVFRGLGVENKAPWRSGPCLGVRIPKTRFGLAVGLWTARAPVERDFEGVRLAFRELDDEERDDALE